MLSSTTTVGFECPDLGTVLDGMPSDLRDALDFGVIGFDDATVVRVYNAYESAAAGLRPERVVGLPLFEVVAQCLNNFLVAQRFDDAAASGTALDTVIDYVLTLRMRPTRCRLRLIATPGGRWRYVLVQRHG